MIECDDDGGPSGSDDSAGWLFATNCMGGAFEVDGFINDAEDVDSFQWCVRKMCTLRESVSEG